MKSLSFQDQFSHISEVISQMKLLFLYLFFF